MKTAATLLRNPALTVGGATVVLFTVARIPTEIFYARFAVRPEDAGLDSVQILLQGSAAALLFSLFVGVSYGFLVTLSAFVYVDMFKRLRARWKRGSAPLAKGTYRTALRRTARLCPIVVPLLSVIFALVYLSLSARSDARAIRHGFLSTSLFVPWHPERVEVTWNEPGRDLSLADCEDLFYLGEGDGRVALYDSRDHKTYRIDSQDIQLDFPVRCEPAT